MCFCFPSRRHKRQQRMAWKRRNVRSHRKTDLCVLLWLHYYYFCTLFPLFACNINKISYTIIVFPHRPPDLSTFRILMWSFDGMKGSLFQFAGRCSCLATDAAAIEAAKGNIRLRITYLSLHRKGERKSRTIVSSVFSLCFDLQSETCRKNNTQIEIHTQT